MSKIRKMAKGQDCQVRLAGVCNYNPETTVLAHIRIAGITGAGQKANDLLGAWCCSSCHDAIDRRIKTEYSDLELEHAHYEGVFRTIVELIRKDMI